jgi:serine/threonine-protein kinase
LDASPEYIGNYRILGKLGKGGMGDIYKAMQEPLNRVVALKVLPPQLSRDDEFSKRFEVEAKAISLLEHQNIVNIYEYGDGDGHRFIAMQFVDGMDLGSYIAEHKRVAVPDIISFSKQICRGLKYAHSRSVIHRDIKPQNILLDKNKTIHISDFGIAKIFSTSEITMTGSTIGTPEYMSPEQAQGKKIDAQSDIYSLGVLMYEMLTGKPPFLANNSMAVAYKQVHETPTPPSAKRKDTPKLLELIILKALKKDKRERYSSAEELLNDLDKVNLQERAERPTVRLNSQPPTTKTQKTAGPKTQKDRRIVERRGKTDRRYGGFADAPFFSGEYWAMMAKTQWLTWMALAALGTAFLLHVKH